MPSTSSAVEAAALEQLVEEMKRAESLEKKSALLALLPSVESFLCSSSIVRSFLVDLSSEERVVVQSLIAIGQAEHLLQDLEEEGALRSLLRDLLPVEQFYKELGGIVGYHAMMLSLFAEREKEVSGKFLPPDRWDITKENHRVRRAVIEGVLQLPCLGEIYPLGGAGDRLSLVDERTLSPLPAAKLLFGGKTLLEGLIEDLQAREYLYYKLTGKRVLTPIAMMTSWEKENHQRILEILEEKRWFGRPKESFKLFVQPLVPVLNLQGKWCRCGKGKLLLKPGGHGVIWKLAQDCGVLDWFASQGRSKALVRQINNPIAGCDYGLLAFSGLGILEKKGFGFSSCSRLIGSQEGMNVLVETQEKEGGLRYLLTNIEYCTFKKHAICDQRDQKGSPFSKYPSNTNILFVDLQAIRDQLKQTPFPGLLINKKRIVYYTEEGERREEEVVRLESTMQSIADGFVHCSERALSSAQRKRSMQSYMTFNRRNKTISCTKREFVLGSSLLETPEGAFLDLLKNQRELLVDHCGWRVPKLLSPALFFAKGPSFVFRYHPSLGPLYSIIAQKLRSGYMALKSELQLEIAELFIEELHLSGSLRIFAAEPSCKKQESYHNGEMRGRCWLRNVKVCNEGIDALASNCYWKGAIQRSQSCEIVLLGNSAFFAENICFKGDWKITVPDGVCMRAVQKSDGSIELVEEKMTTPSWSWNYKTDGENRLQIEFS